MYNFDEYKIETEPDKYQKAENWEIAIGLQAVDGLKPSEYLYSLARQNIEGDLTIDEVKYALKSYYNEHPVLANDEERKDEADKVSANITKVLSEKAFSFIPAEYYSIHKRIFEGVYKDAGQKRKYNITKDEWVLDGDTVNYASYTILGSALEYDFEKEKKFSYKGLSKREIAEHIAGFTTSIWQIHPFSEGNTRTTAVFIIKYLRTLGFKKVSNDLFAQNSWYFRNALVRSAASNVTEGVYPDRIYLDRFFGNLLLGEKNILQNRYLHINPEKLKIIDKTKPQNATINGENATINGENATINGENATINGENATIKDENATINGENATINGENATIKDKNVMINDKDVMINDKNVMINEKNVMINNENVMINHVNVTIKDENATIKDKNVMIKLTAIEMVVLDILGGNGRLSADNIAKDIGKDQRTIRRAFSSLKDKGLIQREGSNKTGYWKVLRGK